MGENAIIGANCLVGEDSHIGKGSRLWANVSVYHDVSIGEDCLVQSGTVIGSDGFGYAPDGQQWIKIPQLGGVRIGNRVEIGANTCVDRGALDDTIINDGVIIDNLCQIAHNVVIGENTAMAGASGIAGSSKVGKNCSFGGQSGAAGHLEITDNVLVTGKTLVTNNISEPGAYSAGIGSMPIRDWRRVNARIRQLDEMHKRLREAEKKLAALE
jgi:UDP-3-O-[3-hydroxymyristoyl] glucosamine N-acyltransferase